MTSTLRFEETKQFLKVRKKKTVFEVLLEAEKNRSLLFQPRCGVGSHIEMIQLLVELETKASPDILSVTIDSYTRLKKFEKASEVLRTNSLALNGYPLVSHGYEKGRELEECVRAPLEVRHGSPDARELFDVSLASGITSFEGGGICYNLPYCKNVPLSDSLNAWRYVDQVCGEFTKDNIIIDRELFGTLSAVLVPPSIAIAMTMLEAILATTDGVRSLSIAYPQSGNIYQDIAALRAIRTIAARLLPKEVFVFPVLHEFMGAFPKNLIEANSLIFLGSLVAKIGGATKIITKSNHEAFGIPTTQANADGILTAKIATNAMLDFISVHTSTVEQEQAWIEQEVLEILTPILQSDNLINSILNGFHSGRLDIPFSTSIHAQSKIIPLRDPAGAIRYFNFGNLAFSDETKKRNLGLIHKNNTLIDFVKKIHEDIFYFSSGYYAKGYERKGHLCPT